MNKSVYEELRRRLGSGGNPRLRDLHYRRLACLIERMEKADKKLALRALQVIHECLQECLTKSDPGRWFTVAVLGRLTDSNLLTDSSREVRREIDVISEGFGMPE
jgi:IS30 family transposase